MATDYEKITTSDRDLLMLAAEAAGLKNPQWCDVLHCVVFELSVKFKDCPWNPLTNPSEAFHLSVQLNMAVYHEPHCDGMGHFAEYEDDYHDMLVTMVETGKDPMAATCRVIVGAAAELAKSRRLAATEPKE